MPIKYAQINATVSGNTTVIPPTVGKVLRVLSVVLTAAGTVTATFTSGVGGPQLTGPLQLAAGQTLASGQAPATVAGRSFSHFETRQGDALVLNLSAAVTVGGWLVVDEANA
jgi:hypothetical protein